jgi:pentatricopeptide repeat protein
LIAAYAQQGQGKEAMYMFLQMQCHGMAPDEVTLRSMLTACSHGGLAVEGSQCWASFMNSLHNIASISHYNNLIDLLVRTGKLADGEHLIDKMPFHPTPTSWLTLLGACKTHTDVERGERAAKNLFALGSESAAPYILLSNIHAAGDKFDGRNAMVQGLD